MECSGTATKPPAREGAAQNHLSETLLEDDLQARHPVTQEGVKGYATDPCSVLKAILHKFPGGYSMLPATSKIVGLHPSAAY